MADEGAPKTSFELAMERLRKKDADAGIETRAVTDEQKAAIAEARSFYGAKIAELEVMHQSKLLDDPGSGRTRGGGTELPARTRTPDVRPRQQDRQTATLTVRGPAGPPTAPRCRPFSRSARHASALSSPGERPGIRPGRLARFRPPTFPPASVRSPAPGSPSSSSAAHR